MEIKHDKRNYRKHSDRNKALIQKSLTETGAGRSIVIDADNEIIGGNGVFEAWGDKPIQVIESDGSSLIVVKRTDLKTDDPKRKQLAIMDNSTSDSSEFDMELLQCDFDSFELESFGVDLPSMEEEVLEAQEDDFDVPEGGIETDIVLGDLFEIGEHRLLCGDSTDSDSVAKLMNGEKADMVHTDPPYGVSYEGGHNKKKRKGIENDTLQGDNLTDLFYDSLLNADLFSKDTAAFYIWYASGKSVETFASFKNLNLKLRAVIQWYKVHSGLGAFMSQYIPNCEPCMYAHKEGHSPQWFGASDEKTVWELQRKGVSEFHPTQKPIELPERAIKNSSKLNDIILDLFCGGGSTMVASHQLKRKCYGMELDPKYCQVIVDRMRKLDPTFVIKKNGEIINPQP
jgi:DNA modification methylase